MISSTDDPQALAESVASLSLRDIPKPLYERLRARADLNHRSMNAEVLVMLEAGLSSRRLSSADLLERIALARTRMDGPILSDALLAAAKDSGRP